MAPGSDGRDTEVLWRQLFDLVTCASCWQAPQYHAPSDEPSQPPVQTLAESLIPSSVLGLSANASLDEEATLLSSQQQSGTHKATSGTTMADASWPDDPPNGRVASSGSPSAASRSRGRLKDASAKHHKHHQSEDQGIELKEAGSNPLLGQYHMHNQQGFVKAKLEPIGRHANGNGAPAANGALSLLDDGTSAYG